MATTNNLRKGLNRKQWELCGLTPVSMNSGSMMVSSRHFKQQQLFVQGINTIYLYLPEEDGFIQVPNSGLGGSFGAGVCGTAVAIGPSGTATAGSATTLTTNQTILRDLRGFKIHITGGPGAGDVVDILSNTIGTNSVITANFSTTITAASTYRLLTPRWYVINAGTQATGASGTFKFYCYALNTWSSGLSITGFTTSISGESKLVATPSFIDTNFVSFDTGTATAGAANTISNTTAAWATNQWTNYQIRITAGTGLGQVRTIASNTANAITVSANWTTPPDATSQYSIEGNDDFLYFLGNNVTSFYRYSISGNSWTTLTSRGLATGPGVSGHWVWGATDSAWTNQNSIINGRRIYSFTGNSSSRLDYYDIPLGTWSNDVVYAPKTETFSQGTKYVYNKDNLYIQKEATGRWFRYNFVTSGMEGWSYINYPQGSAVVGDTAFDYTYKDGATEITFVYIGLNSTQTLLRTIII